MGLNDWRRPSERPKNKHGIRMLDEKQHEPRPKGRKEKRNGSRPRPSVDGRMSEPKFVSPPVLARAPYCGVCGQDGHEWGACRPTPQEGTC
ncbi:MAG: hypothetical protein A3J93_01965 [Candidatus Magasanikbacteria bacterium RIFOXYC2_FULL_42_28]|uniref:Uncharacterized protein n=1 Tax=Candidatus Magasanikbacteria bacterium RIFOXYC2_FULL_42_28 TaxID=1798704 RepID=A0A1F6NWE6_9BACT|nr:MAG: hypothetical protein A3J93_01965 [Candidatus Magasanikbacteria bacterium RIFOXYC2_FULL_42_28]